MVASACQWFGVGDDDRVDVLVVEHAAEVLDEAGLEGRRRRVSRSSLIRFGARFASMSHSVLISTFLQLARTRA